MNKDIFEGNWEQVKGKIKKKWGKLTDDDLDVSRGNRQILAGKIQEKYGIEQEEAEEQIKEYEKTL